LSHFKLLSGYKTLHSKTNTGFTLIELMVVISLISIMLFWSIPRFQNALVLDNTKKVSRWIIAQVQHLKESAVRCQKLYILHVGIDENRLWVTNESMTEKELENARLKGFELPEDVRVKDVEYPGGEKVSAGQADICFYKKDYSDMALIHIQDNGDKQLSLLIEPFLSKIKLYQEYVGFE